MHSGELLTKTQALKVIENQLGFPRPQARYLSWYFEEMDGMYHPIVNFQTLAVEIKERDLVRRLGQIISGGRDDSRLGALIVEIRGVVEKHRM